MASGVKKTIYDFGSNNGDDVPYYLMKADLVVAVEANPLLCKEIAARFASEIGQGRLVVENCIVASSSQSEGSFFIHKTNHVKSQFPRPAEHVIDRYSEVRLPCRAVDQIVAQYGPPHYVKIDIEHYDLEIVRALRTNGIAPTYISAESHTIDVFCELVSMGYRSFKLVDGASVSTVYANRSILGHAGAVSYSFPTHSAGPFGNDVDGRWMSADNFFRFLAFQGLGWKDVHASLVDPPDPSAVPSFKEECLRKVAHRLKFWQ
jgi:FkbM family methyltransferase